MPLGNLRTVLSPGPVLAVISDKPSSLAAASHSSFEVIHLHIFPFVPCYRCVTCNWDNLLTKANTSFTVGKVTIGIEEFQGKGDKEKKEPNASHYN